MKKLFEKEPIWFAVAWIVIYVLTFSAADGLSETIGVPKLLTVCVGLLLSAVLLGFIGKNGLKEYFGLRAVQGDWKSFLYFVPLPHGHGSFLPTFGPFTIVPDAF